MSSIVGKETGCVRILGFEIEKKTSITSLAAFVLSIWGVSQATFYYLQGSSLNLIQPERIIVFKDACHSGKEEILNIVMPVTITNDAQKDYSSILRDIEIQYFLGKRYVYDSEAYVNYGSSTNEKYGVVGCDENKELIFYIEEMKSVPTEIVRGGDSYVEYMMFVPKIPPCKNGGEKCYRENYLSSSDGVSRLKELAWSRESLSFDVTIKYDDRKTQTKSCEVAVNPDVVRALENSRHIDVFCLNRID